MIKSFGDLEVYRESYDLGSQLRRASKSVPANIAEGWAKRRFEKQFKIHLDSAIGSANEMEVHISMARDLGFWDKAFCDNLLKRYNLLGGKLTNLRNKWETY